MSRLVGRAAIRSCLKLVATCAVCVRTSARWPTTVSSSVTVGGPKFHLDRQILGWRQADGLGHPLESAQFERDAVGAGWQHREDEVAILRRDCRAGALQVGRCDADRHAGKREPLGVIDVSVDRACRALCAGRAAAQVEQREQHECRLLESHVDTPPVGNSRSRGEYRARNPLLVTGTNARPGCSSHIQKDGL